MKHTEQKTNTVLRNSCNYQNLYYMKIPDSFSLGKDSRFKIPRKFDSLILSFSHAMACEVKLANIDKIVWTKSRIHQLFELMEFQEKTYWPAIILAEIPIPSKQRIFVYCNIIEVFKNYKPDRNKSLTISLDIFKKIENISNAKIDIRSVLNFETLESLKRKI